MVFKVPEGRGWVVVSRLVAVDLLDEPLHAVLEALARLGGAGADLVGAACADVRREILWLFPLENWTGRPSCAVKEEA